MLERSVFVNKSIRWVYEPGDIRHDTGGTFILRQWLWFLSDVYAHTIRHDNDSSQTDERKQQTCISLTVLYQPHRVLAASLPVPWAVKLKWSVTSRDGRMNGTNWSEWYSTTSSSWRHTHTSTNARTVETLFMMCRTIYENFIYKKKHENKKITVIWHHAPYSSSTPANQPCAQCWKLTARIHSRWTG